MDKHDEIHGFPGGGSNVGVTPGELIVSAIEADAREQQESGTGGGSGMSQDGMSSGGLSSFSLYWDVASKAWKCHEPLVLKPDGSSVSVKEPQGGYGTGAYYLHVNQDADTKAYTAEIKAGGSTGSADEIAVIKLFTIAATEEGTKQYHVGAYVIGKLSVVGEEGKTDGSDPTTLTGGIDAAGADNSGLVVRTYKENSISKLRLDLDGNKNGKTFSIHRILKKDGTDSGNRVFATTDITEPGSLPSESETVITGIEFEFNNNGLECKLTKRTVESIKLGDKSEETVNVASTAEIDVVSDVKYEDTKLKKWRISQMTVLSPNAGENEQGDVFETTPHSQEM